MDTYHRLTYRDKAYVVLLLLVEGASVGAAAYILNHYRKAVR